MSSGLTPRDSPQPGRRPGQGDGLTSEFDDTFDDDLDDIRDPDLDGWPDPMARGRSESDFVQRLVCPRCGHGGVHPLHWGRQVGSVIGAVAGAAGGVAAGCLRPPPVTSPPLRWISLISAAVIGGITAGSVGCNHGAALGDLLDRRILPSHRCRHCAKRFKPPETGR